jgi:hypothetical protein
MKIKVTQFCGLSTSPQWQAWLFRFSREMYTRFVEEMQKSKGCNQNREVMMRFLTELELMGAQDQIIEFLKLNFPHMLEDDVEPEKAVVIELPPDVSQLQQYKSAFDNPNVTFPRRVMAPITDISLDDMIKHFLSVSAAIEYKTIVIDGVLFVEFLLPSEAAIKHMVPASNWLIPKMELLVNNGSSPAAN